MEIHLQQIGEFISANTFSKGAEYFYNGLISKIEWSENTLCCLAKGSEMYTVQITISDNVISKHVCSCPIDNKEFCKHKAALIIYLQEEQLKKLRGNL